MPKGIEVDDTLIQAEVPRFLELLKHPILLRLIVEDYKYIRSLEDVKELVYHFLWAYRVTRWYECHFKGRYDITAYTFWFNAEAMGLAMAKQRNKELRIFTRAHGYDLYDERVPYRSHSIRRMVLKLIDGVFPCSEQGTQYMISHYPKFAAKIHTAYLGTLLLNKEAREIPLINPITFLTVARAESVKQLHLIPTWLSALAKAFPDREFRWIHVGGGSCLSHLHECCRKDLLPSNLTTDLRGPIPNAEVHRLYREETIHWTVLSSSSEGLPICLAEALSYGTPVIAPNVGGISEIVNKQTGLLLPKVPTTKDFLQAISPFLQAPQRYASIRSTAYKVWCEKFDAGKLRSQFAHRIARNTPFSSGLNR